VLRALASIAFAATALAAAGCGGHTAAAPLGSADLSTGKQLFTEKCAGCHTLQAAGAQGKVGPSLDDAFGYAKEQGFSEATFYTIVLRQIDEAAAPMPTDLVTGQDATDVAAFVARCAKAPDAKENAADAGCAQGGAVTGSDPKTLFTSAGCSGCHTFSKAGSSGTVGPNLDQAHPSFDLAVHQITNGGAIMPAFKGKLTAKQIQILAKFVSGG